MLAEGASAQYTGPVAVSQHSESTAALKPPLANQLLASITAGATINSGNTDSYAYNAGGRLLLTRRPHLLSLDVLGTMAFAKNDVTNDNDKTAANVFGRARYDLFLTQMDALFLAVQPRRDTFAGLDLRLQNQIGYVRTLYFPSDAHRFWGELGYDLTFDNFAPIDPGPQEYMLTGSDTPAEVPSDVTVTYTRPGMITTPDNDLVHSARAFFGYNNTLYTYANLNFGAEILFDVEDPANLRVNGIAEITSSVTQRFKLGIQSRLFYDRRPVANKDPTDLVLSAQIVYTFDSLAAQVSATCPPCDDCSALVKEAQAACEPPVAPIQEGEPPIAPESAPSEPSLPPPAQPSAPAEPPGSPVAPAPVAPAPAPPAPVTPAPPATP